MHVFKQTNGHTYRIAHCGADGGLACESEFEATDAACALFALQRFVPKEQTILIKEDGKELGTVSLTSEGFWSVSRSPQDHTVDPARIIGGRAIEPAVG